MKKSLAITLAAAALILVTAFATLTVLAAVAGQRSGLEKSRGLQAFTVGAVSSAPTSSSTRIGFEM
jgi:hypothetical protein